ncbi:hypothetical protein [uncultured Microbulbifer sp.]|uniref:hypothetical protein n=1 Tax=uncultured Microbulbifer sp. TaxID=348147 RepID=UPI0026300234|nr:hypothetical protein [uncultured Microbulbifer sp.]
MKDKEIVPFIEKKLKYSTYAIILSFLALLAGVILGFCRLTEVDYFWFQRSGALIVLFSAAAEYHLFVTSNYIDQGDQFVGNDKWEENYGGQYKNLKWAAHSLLLIGTLIWGFGDIPFKLYWNL